MVVSMLSILRTTGLKNVEKNQIAIWKTLELLFLMS